MGVGSTVGVNSAGGMNVDCIASIRAGGDLV